MSQPRLVLIAERSFAHWRSSSRCGDDLATSRSMDEHAALSADLRLQHAVAIRQTTGGARSAPPAKQGRVKCVQRSSPQWRAWASAFSAFHRAWPPRHRAPRSQPPPIWGTRPIRLTGAPIATGTGGGTIGIIVGGTDCGRRAGQNPARSPHPIAIAGRASRPSAAMKLARASARLSPRGSST